MQQIVSREEALAFGLSDDAILRKVKAGIWQQPFPGVYFTFSGRPSFSQRLLAACRWSGGVASHRTAGTLYKLMQSSLIELTTTHKVKSPSPDVVIHRVAAIDRRDVTRVGPVPATTPIRTVIDLAAVAERSLLRNAVYEAIRLGLVTAGLLSCESR